jgi:hypothetical protein
MKKGILKSLSFVMVFAMIFGIVGIMPNVNAESTTSAVQKIVVAAVTMRNSTTRTALANNITNIDENGDSLGFTDEEREAVITAAFANVDSYLLQPGYVDAVIAKMDEQSAASRILIRDVIIEGAPATIDYDRTGFEGSNLYNKLNDMIAGGHSNDNGIKFLVKLFQSTAEVYNDPVAGDDSNNIAFEITGFHQVLADALFSELMVSFETLNDMITNKDGEYATYTELLAYSAEIINDSGKAAEFKRLLIANSKANYPIYSGSVSLLPVTPVPGPIGGGGGGAAAPAPETPTNDAGTVTTTPTADGGNKATLEVDPAAIASKITATTDGSIKLDLTAVKDATAVAVKIPDAAFDKIIQANKAVTLQTEKAAIVLPVEVLRQLAQASANVDIIINVNIVKEAPIVQTTGSTAVAEVIDFTITSGGKTVSSFEKPVKVTMKIDGTKVKDYRKVSAYYYNETTKAWNAIGGYMNKITGELTFATSHFSKYAAIEKNKLFSDVSTPWAKDSIEVLAARNIMNGIAGDQFAPQANISRAEVAAMIVRALGVETKAATGSFTDVSASKWYAAEVEAAAKAGIVGGIGDNKFAPEAEITREQIATMIYKALEYKQGKTTLIPTVKFNDGSIVSDYAKNAVAVVAHRGIVKGSDNKFMPKQNATREQVAVMIYRLLETLGEM